MAGDMDLYAVISPLQAAGIDPDAARANPALIAALTGGSGSQGVPSASSAPDTSARPVLQYRDGTLADQPKPMDLSALAPAGAGPSPAGVPPSGKSAPSYAQPVPRPQVQDDTAPASGGLSQLKMPAPIPKPSVPAAVSTSGAPQQKPWTDYVRQGLDAQVSNLNSAQESMKGLPTPADEFAKEQALEQQRNSDAALLSQGLRDPQTGQLLQQYRPTVGQRILRGVGGAVRGLTMGGIPGAIMGAGNPRIFGGTDYGSANSQGQQELRREKGAVSSDDQSIAEQARRFTAAYNAARGIATDQRANAASGKDIVSGAVDQEKAENSENKPGAEPKTYEQMVLAAQTEPDPNGPYHQAVKSIESSERKRFAAPNPGHTAGKEELWVNAFKSEYGRNPTAEEIMGAGVAGGGTAGGAPARPAKAAATFKDDADIQKYSDSWYSKQRAQVRADKTAARLNAGGTVTPEAQEEMNHIESEYQQRAAAHEANKAQWRAQLKSGGKPISVDETGAPLHNVDSPGTNEFRDPNPPQPVAGAPSGQGAPKAPAAKSSAKPLNNPNDPNQVAIARSYLQKAGGDKNKARQLAKRDGYTF